MPCRILFVDHAPALGGAEVGLLLSLELLDRNQFTPYLATQPGQLADAARGLGVGVHEVPLARLRWEPTAGVRLLRGTAALAHLIRDHHIDLVYSNTMRASFYAALAARLTRRPLVWHVHDILPRGAYVRSMCRTCTAAVAISLAVAAPLPCTEKVCILPQGVRLDDFAGDRGAAARRLRAAWGVPPGATVVGQVARLQPWKGQRDVLAVAETLLKDCDDLHFAILGGDIFNDAAAYARELRTVARARGLGDRVIFAGHQSDIAAALHALDILVHASTDEPFGRILIEAAAAGLPIVAYDGGGVPDILTHERTALLVPTGDAAGLATALRRLLTDSALGRALGAAARSDVAERFDVQRLTRELEAILGRVLGGS